MTNDKDASHDVWKSWGMFSQCDITLKNCNGLYMLKGYGHTLRIIRNKELMRITHNGLQLWIKKSSKGVETKVKTTISIYGNGNEVIFLMCAPHMIMFFPKQQLSLHMLSWMMHSIPNIGGLDQLWQGLLRF